MSLRALFIIFPLFLVGCATRHDEVDSMVDRCPTCYQSWFGSPINSLSELTGKPLDNGYGSHHYYQQINEMEHAVAEKKVTFEEGLGVVRQLNGSRYPLWQRTWEDHQPDSMKAGSGWNGPR